MGIVISVVLAEVAFYWLNNSTAAYPLVVYGTEKPGV